MPDELDMMLQGDDPNLASQAQNGGQGDDQSKPQADGQQTPEEIEFNSLSGSTQDRIRRLAKDKRDLSERLANLERNGGGNQYIPPAPGSPFVDPNEQAAIQTLASKGIATDEKVSKFVDDRFNRLRWEFEQQRLEGKYQGQSGEPQYVREEVEDFISSHPQYQNYAPEDVFKYKMFPDEFMNLELQKRGTRTGQSSTLRPTKTNVQQESMTPEYIEQRMQQPDGRQWYDEHLDEINATLSKMNPNR